MDPSYGLLPKELTHDLQPLQNILRVPRDHKAPDGLPVGLLRVLISRYAHAGSLRIGITVDFVLAFQSQCAETVPGSGPVSFNSIQMLDVLFLAHAHK